MVVCNPTSGETKTPEMVFSVPCLENDGALTYYIFDAHQPILIILCIQ